MTNLGMIAVLQKRFDEARDWFQQLDAAQPRGRRHLDGRHLPQQPRQRDARPRRLRRRPASHYADSLRAYRDYDDRWAMAFLLEDIGVLAALVRRRADRRFELIGAADALRDAIGTPRAPTLEQELESQLDAAATDLSADERSALRARGRSLDLAAGVALALELCERSSSFE